MPKTTLKGQAKSVPGKRESDLLRKVSDLQYRLESEKKACRAAELRAKEAEDLLADHHASRFDIPRQKIRKYQGKGSWIRVAFGDTHGALIEKKAWNAFLLDLEELKPREIVHGGDIVECGGWLARHHTLGYVAETDYTYSDDIVASNRFLDQLQHACPLADIHALQGNHDARIEKFAVDAAMKNKADSEMLRRAIDPEFLLHLNERGIRWYRRCRKYNRASVPGTIRLGKCWFTHPQSSSKHHAANMVQKFKDNVVFFHTHRRDSYPASSIDGDEYGAWNPGCMCKLQKLWRHTEPSNHNHGYHVQLCRPDGSFLPINVPIIRGKSYLTGLLKIGSGK